MRIHNQHYQKRSPQALNESLHAMDQWVNQLIETFEHRFDDAGVTLELDLQNFEAMIDPRLVQIAVQGLLENAIQVMPGGGEICVTLLDADLHWELEIADNSQGAFGDLGENNISSAQSAAITEDIDDLPVIVPYPANDHLRAAHRAAMLHGGQVQSFDCPQGGTAYVLVVPQRKRNRQIA